MARADQHVVMFLSMLTSRRHTKVADPVPCGIKRGTRVVVGCRRLHPMYLGLLQLVLHIFRRIDDTRSVSDKRVLV